MTILGAKKTDGRYGHPLRNTSPKDIILKSRKFQRKTPMGRGEPNNKKIKAQNLLLKKEDCNEKQKV